VRTIGGSPIRIFASSGRSRRLSITRAEVGACKTHGAR
jgi:hypothetical protein